MHDIITILLGLAAIYCGGMWLWLVAKVNIHRDRYSYEAQVEIERNTFHLGLCAALILGFLYLGGR